jgi:hypothetical protein
MTDFKKIFLQPECCVEDQDVGRMWCQDAINDCEEGNEWIEYLLASDVKQRIAELEAIIRGRDELINNAESSRIAELEAEVKYIKLEAVETDAECDAMTGKIAELEKERETKSDFQQRVIPWMDKCFGPEISSDAVERNHRFLEESLELVQALGCKSSEAHQLVDYVYGRPLGEPFQEVGGVMVTLAALCIASNLDMHKNGETELTRIWTMVEKIRAKQAVKPKHSPIPEALKDRG